MGVTLPREPNYCAPCGLHGVHREGCVRAGVATLRNDQLLQEALLIHRYGSDDDKAVVASAARRSLTEAQAEILLTLIDMAAWGTSWSPGQRAAHGPAAVVAEIERRCCGDTP